MSSNNNEKSNGRVLSVRLPNSTLLGCFDFCELYSIKTGNSLSSAIVRTLEGVLATLRSQELIPTYNSEEIAGELLDSFGPAGKKIRVKNELPEIHAFRHVGTITGRLTTSEPSFREIPRQNLVCRPNPTNDDFAPEAYAEEDFADNITTGNETDFDRELMNELSSEAYDVAELPYIDVEGEDFKEFCEELSKQIEQEEQERNKNLLGLITIKPDTQRVQKTELKLVETTHNVRVSLCDIDEDLKSDKFYKNALENGNELLQRAIRLVYHALPKSEWASEKAQRLIERTILGISTNEKGGE